MTARQQIRVGRRLRGDRAPVDATLAPGVGDMLYAAREKKGVDLYRAERDTKIRARHLSALEDGDYAALPGAVYTKGFLRNYSLYLGLDPTEVLDRWHQEQDPGQRLSGAAAVAPPQPLTDPSRGLTFTPGLAVAAALSVVVILFLGYVGMQLFRFAQVPELRLDGSSMVQIDAAQKAYLLSGVSPAHATVKALDPAGTLVRSAEGGGDGRWTLEVPVQKGRNEFTLSARDPETGRESASLPIIILVALPASPTPIPTPAPTRFGGSAPSVAPSEAVVEGAAASGVASLAVAAPDEGSRIDDPTVTVKGTSNADRVRIAPRWTGSGKAPGKPEVADLDTRDGAFSGSFVLAPGTWAFDISTEATDELASTTQTRTIEVDYSGFVVEVGATSRGQPSIEVWADGNRVKARRTFEGGERLVVVARRNVVITTDATRETVVGVQGDQPTRLGTDAGPGVWRVDKGKAPQQQP